MIGERQGLGVTGTGGGGESVWLYFPVRWRRSGAGKGRACRREVVGVVGHVSES